MAQKDMYAHYLSKCQPAKNLPDFTQYFGLKPNILTYLHNSAKNTSLP